MTYKSKVYDHNIHIKTPCKTQSVAKPAVFNKYDYFITVNVMKLNNAALNHAVIDNTATFNAVYVVCIRLLYLVHT